MTKTEFNHKAFEIFRVWSSNANKIFPNYAMEIVDEQCLIVDCEDCFEKAIESLQKDEKKTDRKTIGYDYGYITGYVKNSLNVKWMYEYIEKQSEPFKMFMANKAMEQFFKVDTLTVERITKLYYYMYYKDINLMNSDENLRHETIIEAEIEDLNEAKDNPILQMINNNITTYLNKYLTQDKANFVPDISNYFTYSEISNYFINYTALGTKPSLTNIL